MIRFAEKIADTIDTFIAWLSSSSSRQASRIVTWKQLTILPL